MAVPAASDEATRTDKIATLQKSAAPPKPYSGMIAVAGTLGSGKTTLTQGLASALNWSVQPSTAYDLRYIEDQINEPSRWTLEAQLAFLTHKVSAISQAIRRQEKFVVDRSPYEDFEVFGSYWASLGYMDERSWATYKNVAELIIAQVPPPLALVYCDVRWEVSERRLTDRPRPYQRRYPHDHLRTLAKRYDSWVSTIESIPVLRVDTEALDVRDPKSVGRVIDQLVELLDQDLERQQPQLPLFELSHPPATRRSRLARGRNLPSTSVYIASGFSAHETSVSDMRSSDQEFLDISTSVSGIPPGDYRTRLSAVADAFSIRGYRSFLPHRDINQWGQRTMTPRQVANECLAAVAECDMFFGILGTSYGSHSEAAAALAIGKPAILVRLADTEETFFGRGLRELEGVVSLEAETIAALPEIIRSSYFDDLIKSARRIRGV